MPNIISVCPGITNASLWPDDQRKTSGTSVARIEALSHCILSEYASDHSGETRDEILATFGGFLVRDLNNHFFRGLHQQRADEPVHPSVWGHSSISVEAFETFLRTQGPSLVVKYKRAKEEGRTACSPVSDSAADLLNAAAPPNCAAVDGISHHVFNLVRVDQKPYLLDFTFDQFLDYDTIRKCSCRTVETVGYAGVLLMPVDRMRFKLDRAGRLIQ